MTLSSSVHFPVHWFATSPCIKALPASNGNAINRKESKFAPLVLRQRALESFHRPFQYRYDVRSEFENVAVICA
jgi:hypothetical protein